MDFTVGGIVWFTQPLFYKGEIVEGEITKVGNKYVYVKALSSSREFKFDKKTLREVDESNYVGQIYPSKQEYLNEVELNKNMKKIRNKFNDFKLNLTLEQTIEILKILNQN